MAQSSLELFKLTPPKPFTLFCFVFPEELSIEFPLLLTSTCWPKLGASAGSLGAMWCLPFWGWNITNFCFPESLLHLLLWPQLTDHHTKEHSAFTLYHTTGSNFLLLVFLSSTEAESFQNNWLLLLFLFNNYSFNLCLPYFLRSSKEKLGRSFQNILSTLLSYIFIFITYEFCCQHNCRNDSTKISDVTCQRSYSFQFQTTCSSFPSDTWLATSSMPVFLLGFCSRYLGISLHYSFSLHLLCNCKSC